MRGGRRTQSGRWASRWTIIVVFGRVNNFVHNIVPLRLKPAGTDRHRLSVVGVWNGCRRDRHCRHQRHNCLQTPPPPHHSVQITSWSPYRVKSPRVVYGMTLEICKLVSKIDIWELLGRVDRAHLVNSQNDTRVTVTDQIFDTVSTRQLSAQQVRTLKCKWRNVWKTLATILRSSLQIPQRRIPRL